jgi:hypothetical protein
MKRLTSTLIAVATGLTFSCLASANILSTTPVAPDPFAAIPGSQIATTSGSGSATVAGITDSVSFTESVFQGANAVSANPDALTFVITANVTAGQLGSLTNSPFTGFTVDGGILTGSSGTAPTTIQLNGGVVKFNYSTPINAGGSTDTLILETNATSFAPGPLSFQDGTTVNGTGFAPTPEPRLVGFLLTAGLGLVVVARRFQVRHSS